MSGDADGEVFLCNFDGKIKGALKGHTDSVECLGFSSKLPLAISGSMDKSLRVWDLATLSTRQELQLEGGVLHCQWHPTEELILVSHSEGKTSMYDARNLEVVKQWSGPTAIINDLAVSADWKQFVTIEDGGPCLVFSTEK
jgi:WD40 repeat protein